jgi:release factor glutamine methyltransferase
MKKENEPIEYSKGYKKFLKIKIDLSKKPLIPRLETEYWVGEVIKKLKIENSLKIVNCKLKILDLFCGSGCIGLAILRYVKNSKVVFADKEKNAIKQIKINLKINKLKGKAIQSDVFKSLVGKYDCILANPPYVAYKKINQVQKSVLENEPHSALFGGEDGLFYINKFLKDAKKYLNINGIIFMEFSPEQKNKIVNLLKSFKYKNWKFHKDQFNRWRWVSIS